MNIAEEVQQGRFPLVQPSHLRKYRPFGELTQDQRQIRAKLDARTDADWDLLIRTACKQSPRRFTGEPITVLGGL